MHTTDIVKTTSWMDACMDTCTDGRMDTQHVQKTLQERPAVADKPARRLQNECTVYVRAVGL